MISPFAGFFCGRVKYDSFLGVFPWDGLTAWRDGFFLNHFVVTESAFLERQRFVGRYISFLEPRFTMMECGNDRIVGFGDFDKWVC